MQRLEFPTEDYIVMGIFLVITSAIGVYYGVFKKVKTTEEYAFGNRQIHFIPVAFSMAVTFQSAASIIGVPTEVYLHNIMLLYMAFGSSIAYIIQAFFIVPLVHPLRLTSVYEYLQRRFQSRAVQLLGMTIGILQTLLYVSIVLYTPALALEAVAGIPIWLSIVLIGGIGTLYTAIGGIKTVIWTDTFQFVVLYGGLIVILIKSIQEIGSMSQVLKLSRKGDRMSFYETNPDPRVRHTVWGCVFGGLFNWLPICCNQSSVQRISSIEKARDAKIAALLNIPLSIIFTTILLLTGLVMYAYFVLQVCDPLANNQLSNANQLMIYFVMKTLNDIPGLAGMFLAVIFSGSLSSLSSGIHSMAINALQDILIGYNMESLRISKTCILKLLVLLGGILTVSLALLSQYLTGPVSQMGNTAFGAAGGPVVGIFFMGSAFPQANKKGALVGGICGIAFNMWIAIGSFLYGRKPPLSKRIGTSGCIRNVTDYPELNITLPPTSYYTSTLNSIFDHGVNETKPEETLHNEQSVADNHIAIYDLSYVWFGLTGFLCTVILGLTVSFITGKDNEHPTEPKYISPALRRFWTFDESNLRDNQGTENCYPLIHKEETEFVCAKKETVNIVD